MPASGARRTMRGRLPIRRLRCRKRLPSSRIRPIRYRSRTLSGFCATPSRRISGRVFRWCSTRMKKRMPTRSPGAWPGSTATGSCRSCSSRHRLTRPLISCTSMSRVHCGRCGLQAGCRSAGWASSPCSNWMTRSRRCSPRGPRFARATLVPARAEPCALSRLAPCWKTGSTTCVTGTPPPAIKPQALPARRPSGSSCRLCASAR